MLLSILGRRLQRGRQQRLGAEVDAAAPAPSCRPTLPPAPEQPAHPVARYTEHGAPTPAALDDPTLWARYKREVEATKIHAVIIVRIYDGDKALLSLRTATAS